MIIRLLGMLNGNKLVLLSIINLPILQDNQQYLYKQKNHFDSGFDSWWARYDRRERKAEREPTDLTTIVS